MGAPDAPVGRFAPSPTGRMHLGNAFSALLAWLSVRSEGGRMILRIEDLDPDRSRPAYADAIRKDMEWLGLDWDAESEPQSRRTAAYEAAFAKLEDLVYPCYCTRAQLHAASAPHASDGLAVYPGTCRDLPSSARPAGRKPAWRLRVPDVDIEFRDGLMGPVRENLARDCGDFIIRRSDGVYAYQLAVVVDDAEAGVTQVVRGCDLLRSTPRQIFLFRLLDAPIPEYCHVPLLCAPDGRRLSKRDGDLDLGALRQRFSSEQLVGLLACAAGLRPDPQPVRACELVRSFCWEAVTKQPAIDIRKQLESI